MGCPGESGNNARVCLDLSGAFSFGDTTARRPISARELMECLLIGRNRHSPSGAGKAVRVPKNRISGCAGILHPFKRLRRVAVPLSASLILIVARQTECAPGLVREQKLLTEVLSEVRKQMPFALLGFETDNDSVLMNESVKTYCDEAGLVSTRCRPYRKNDQAWAEQKNGSVVRRIVGRHRYGGLSAAAALTMRRRLPYQRARTSMPSSTTTQRTNTRRSGNGWHDPKMAKQIK
jgi:hypothetical protein